MCGRYVIDPETGWPRKLVEGEPGFGEWADYNVSPSRMVPALGRISGQMRMFEAHWGLVPGWAKDWDAMKTKPINARVETVAEKPMFRGAFKRGRVAIPASGYYEWQATPDGKQPHYIHPADGQPLFFAGLAEVWGPEDKRSVTIITGPSTGPASTVHDRMPMMLTWPRGIELWTSDADDPADLLALLEDETNAIADSLIVEPVSRAVNSPRNNSPELIQPIEFG